MRKLKVDKKKAKKLLCKGISARLVAKHFKCSRQYICSAFPAEIEIGRIARQKAAEKLMGKK